MSTIDKILLGLVGFLVGFTVTIIILFCVYQKGIKQSVVKMTMQGVQQEHWQYSRLMSEMIQAKSLMIRKLL